MNNKRIWLSLAHMGGKEQEFIKDAFDTNWIVPMGPNVDGFERDLESFLKSDSHVAALSAGTAALHLGLILLGVGVGDEVICQSFTFAASANPIIYLGAKPVFVDSEPDTWNICPNQLERAIIDRILKGKKPKAIIVVHLYGMPAKMNEILTIAAKYEIAVLEDAAEALGAQYEGRMCGTFGDLGVLSFNGNKIITTSGGGALVCKSKEMAEKARFLATQARDDAPHYQHSQIGYNYRMSNVVAAIGRGQMLVLQDRVEKRRSNFAYYKSMLSPVNGIDVHQEPGMQFFSNYWLTTILIKSDLLGGIDREKIRISLEGKNIETRPLWKPMHLQPVFSGLPYYGDGVCDSLFKQGLCLPSGSGLEVGDLKRVVDEIQRTINL